MEFAVEAVAVAQTPLAARAETLVAILHAFPQRRAPAVVLAIPVLRDLVPLPGGLVVDAFTLIVIGFSCAIPPFASPEPEAAQKEEA